MAKTFHFLRQYQAKAAIVATLIVFAFQLPSSAPASIDDDDSLHPGPQTIGVGLPPNHKTLAQLDEAVRKAPTSATAYLARGNGYLAGSEMEKARADFNKALQIDPHCGRAHIGLYYVLCGSSHANEALLRELKKAEKAGPPDLAMDAANLAGNLYLQNKQYKEALTEFTRVINSHLFSKRRLAQVYVDRGMTYDRLHNADAAIADYSSSIKLNNVLGHAYLYRANDFCGQGNFKKAFADYSFVASYTEHMPVEKLPTEMAEARNGLYEFRANYYKSIKRPDLAKADLIKLKQLQKEEMDLSPFLLK